ncbi:MAG: stage III sporulation protein AE [Oscillospiraceae bacterium]|nr:stage III sporulation protein AE [Oscillospiraceae bacterium]
MKRILIILVLFITLATPVRAQDLTAPEVPEHAEKFMPAEQENFAQGLLEVFRDALVYIRPDLKEAASVCLHITAVIIAISLLRTFPGTSEKTVNLAGGTAIALILLQSTGSLVNLASVTVTQISEYGKLLLPVMTAAMAGQGGVSSSAALYAGTALFDALLTSLIGKLLTPMVYLFLLLAVACCAIGEDILKKLRDMIKWATTWLLKTILYIYTGYISITGVVSGATDAAALKAAKLAISSAVPVVGGILSDASEAVLVGAGSLKNAAGIYGLFAIIAIWIGPFLRIAAHYLLLKATGSVCSIFACKSVSELVQDFSTALGLLLAMTGTISLILLISLVCFLRGVG